MENESFASIVPEHIVARDSVESNLLQPRSLGKYEQKSLAELQALFDAVPGQKYKTALEGRGSRQKLTITQQIEEDRSSIGEDQEGKVDVQTVFSADGLIAAIKTHREGSKIPDTLVTFQYKKDPKDQNKKRLVSSSAYFINKDGESHLSEKVTYKYTQTAEGTIIKAKTDTSKSYGIFSLLPPSPTESLATHQQKVAQGLR